MGLFIIWTTFICLNGEIRASKGMGFVGNMYSSNIYTTQAEINSEKERWYRIYKGDCIPFMIQHEEISSELILKQILGFK